MASTRPTLSPDGPTVERFSWWVEQDTGDKWEMEQIVDVDGALYAKLSAWPSFSDELQFKLVAIPTLLRDWRRDDFDYDALSVPADAEEEGEGAPEFGMRLVESDNSQATVSAPEYTLLETRPRGYAIACFDVIVDGEKFGELYCMKEGDEGWHGRTDTGIHAHRKNSADEAALELLTTPEPCQAFLFHGPGHQSKTRCRVEGEHEIHEAETNNGISRWKGLDPHHGISRCSGFFDEPTTFDDEN